MDYSFSQFRELNGQYIDLLRLTENLIEPLTDALYSPETFFVRHRGYNTKEIVRERLVERFVAQEKNKSLTLVAVNKSTKKLAGMSSFLSPSIHFSKVEIGFTWLCDESKRTFVNTEMKYLMLTYAFERMKVKRVEFSIAPENTTSVRAIQRIGAKFEGTLRKWRFNSDSDKGDRSIFSIIDDEWPEVKLSLNAKLRL
jgi:N-acetyltransferase